MYEWIKSVWSFAKRAFKRIHSLWKISENIEKLEKLNNQEKFINLNEKLFVLTNENLKLKSQLCIKGETHFDGRILWLNREKICLKCWDDSNNLDRKVSRLLRNNPFSDESYYCTICKTPYRTVEGDQELKLSYSRI